MGVNVCVHILNTSIMKLNTPRRLTRPFLNVRFSVQAVVVKASESVVKFLHLAGLHVQQ